MSLTPGTTYTDLTGRRIGRLTVVRLVDKPDNRKSKGKYWLCMCDCGKSHIAASSNLTKAVSPVQSCGCLKRECMRKLGQSNMIDLTDRVFGELTVLRRAAIPDTAVSRNLRWLCKCTCGREKVISSAQLLRGTTNSCGYHREGVGLRKSSNIPSVDLLSQQLYKQLIAQADSRDILFDMSLSEFSELYTQPCHYCGALPGNVFTYRGIQLVYSGLDRLDSSVGYAADNCVPCCKVCNVAKQRMSVPQFKNWILSIYNHLKLGETNASTKL